MVSVLDSTLMQGNFSTPELRKIWSDSNKLEKQLEVEKALAKAQGKLGIIPEKAAEKIVEQAQIENFDIKELSIEATKKRHTLMPLINKLAKLAGPEDGQFVHYGVTTQDIVDTGIILQTKEAYEIIRADGRKLLATITKKAAEYQNTPMIGRTHGVHAIPITFGFKLATWASELARDQQRLECLADEVFVGSISGAVGTYAAIGLAGIDLEEAVLDELGLRTPQISWQSSRDRFSEFASTLAIYSGTLGKIGNELFTLMRTEINEVAEPFIKGEVGSSTMPQKRNPALLEGLASLTYPVFKDASLMFESMLFNNERDAIHWRSEWVVLPEITNFVDAQLRNANYILSDLVVNETNMLENIHLQGDLIFAENIMFNLGKVLGKQRAHSLVHQSAMQAIEEGKDFISLLEADPEIKANFSSNDLKAWTDISSTIAPAVKRTQQVVEEVDAYLKTLE